MKDLENIDFDNKKVHKDFYKVASRFLVSGTQEPIVLEGPQDSQKELIVENLAELMGYNPHEYNFCKMTRNGQYYGMGLMGFLASDLKKDKFVVINGVDEDSYDEIELTALIRNNYGTITNKRHPEFRMLILRDTDQEKTTEYSPLYTKCSVIQVTRDHVLEVQEQTSEKSNQKVKDVK